MTNPVSTDAITQFKELLSNRNIQGTDYVYWNNGRVQVSSANTRYRYVIKETGEVCSDQDMMDERQKFIDEFNQSIRNRKARSIKGGQTISATEGMTVEQVKKYLSRHMDLVLDSDGIAKQDQLLIQIIDFFENGETIEHSAISTLMSEIKKHMPLSFFQFCFLQESLTTMETDIKQEGIDKIYQILEFVKNACSKPDENEAILHRQIHQDLPFIKEADRGLLVDLIKQKDTDEKMPVASPEAPDDKECTICYENIENPLYIQHRDKDDTTEHLACHTCIKRLEDTHVKEYDLIHATAKARKYMSWIEASKSRIIEEYKKLRPGAPAPEIDNKIEHLSNGESRTNTELEDLNIKVTELIPEGGTISDLLNNIANKKPPTEDILCPFDKQPLKQSKTRKDRWGAVKIQAIQPQKRTASEQPENLGAPPTRRRRDR